MKTAALKDFDLYLFHQGTNYHAYEMLGAHLTEAGKVRFALWAPHAKAVSLVGDFNDWQIGHTPLKRLGDGEIWVTYLGEGRLTPGDLYKYAIEPESGGEPFLKADPYGFWSEVRPATASRLYNMSEYRWQDDVWQAKRRRLLSYEGPMLIYEVHAGSWRRHSDGSFMTYRELADTLVPYVKEMNYTHIEFLPLTEHPLDESAGYQVTGFYAVTSRYGAPDDFRYLVDKAHLSGIGVIMDWVPDSFCRDNPGLRAFDGGNLYESDNPQLTENRNRGTLNFDYGRTEVQSFLVSNAIFWLEEYHIDGLRLSGSDSMLYLDYGRGVGEWTPNKYGDKSNLEGIALLKKLNEVVFHYHPEVLMITEESAAGPLMARTVGGDLGFNLKWNLSWSAEALEYLFMDPAYRKWNHERLTYSLKYAFTDNFLLPLSHNEVSDGRSVFFRLPGDLTEKYALLKAFYGYWLAHPGKKLIFMGAEFGQQRGWDLGKGLDWPMAEDETDLLRRQMLGFTRDLNEFYRKNRSLWEFDFITEGFEWIDSGDSEHSVLSFLRRGEDPKDFILAVINFSPNEYTGYRLGVPIKGYYREVFNSDAKEYGGAGHLNRGDIPSANLAWQGRPQSIALNVPPLSALYFRLRPAVTANKVRIIKMPKPEVCAAGPEDSQLEQQAAAVA